MNVGKFNLYYQEYIDRNETYLRKIRLNLVDLRKIEAELDIDLNKEQQLVINKSKKDLTFNNVEIGETFNYHYYTCTRQGGCYNGINQVTSSPGRKIMKLDFTSVDFTGEELIDFSLNYGRIKYKDSNGKIRQIDVKNALNKDALNKSLYLTIPDEVAQSSEIKLEYTVRNHRYTFKLR